MAQNICHVQETRENTYCRPWVGTSQPGYHYASAEHKSRKVAPFNDWMKDWITPKGYVEYPHKGDVLNLPPRIPESHKIMSKYTLQANRARTLSPNCKSQTKKPCPGPYPNRTNWKLHAYGGDILPTRGPGGISYRLPEMPYH